MGSSRAAGFVPISALAIAKRAVVQLQEFIGMGICRFAGFPEDELRPGQRAGAPRGDTAERNLGKEKQGTSNLLCEKGKEGKKAMQNSKVLKNTQVKIWG